MMGKDDLTTRVSECGNYVEYLDENGRRVEVRLILQHDQYARNKNSDKSFKEMMEDDEKKKRDKTRYKEKDVKEFIQVKRIVEKVLRELTQVETHCLAKLLTILEFNNKPFKIDGKEANTTTFISFFGVSKKTVTNFFKKLVALKVIKSIPKGNEVFYRLQKNYIAYGPLDNHEQNSIKIFQKKLMECIQKVELLMESEIKKLKADKNSNTRTVFYPLSMFMALLSYVHPQTFIVCANINDSLEQYFDAENTDDVLAKVITQMRNIEPLGEFELWKVISGKKNIKRISSHEKERMDTYINILKEAHMIASLETSTKIIFFNPELLFVTTHLKNPIIREFVVGLFQDFGQKKTKEDKRKRKNSKEKK